jgi:N-acyl-D-amino-acid deacylase
LNATVHDGTGADAASAGVRIEGDTIVAFGDVSPSEADEVVDASGLILAPGFIDTHSHGDGDLFENRDALAAVSQGITTIVVGQDGGSEFPLSDFFARIEREPVSVNVASYAGHGTIREEVMGDDYRREATEEEIEKMRQILLGEMQAGALGLATGLEYDPGIYSSTDEVITLAREAASWGGRYMSHLRSEDRYFWEAVEETLTIGREANLPVQISHTKLALRSLFGQTERLLERLDEARAEGIDVTADIYPYTYWQSTLTVMFPDRDFENREAALFAVTELSSPENMLIPVYAPEPSYAGKTLAEIAALRGQESDPAQTLIDLIRDAEEHRASGETRVESVIATSMDEADIEELMRWPHMNFCTDGALDGAHPRGYGTYPRILGRYVRERSVLPLAQAIRKMTSLAATNVGIGDRGRIAVGQKADLVLFDEAGVIDHATPDEPHLVSEGIEGVWVNGEAVFEAARTTGRYPGRVLRREAASSSE